MENFSQNPESSLNEQSQDKGPILTSPNVTELKDRKWVFALVILLALIGVYLSLAKYENWWPFRDILKNLEYMAPEFLSFISEEKIDKALAVKLSRNESAKVLLTVKQKEDKQTILTLLNPADYELLEDFQYSETFFIRINSPVAALKLLNDNRVLSLRSNTPASLFKY
ncbi:MAG: hypothetical protein Q8R55_06330 [Candidatus Taylorbacteria bacterium]|nr:hypothetical protein [Candidatus Taylorbacteria bacterium]